MPRWIRAMSRKRRIVGNSDIFLRGDGGSFRFGASVGKKPAGKSARETAGNVATSWAARRSCCRNRRAQVSGGTRNCFFAFRLRLVRFRLDNWRNGRGRGLATILGERFARQNDGFFGGLDGCGGTGRMLSIRRAMIEPALRGATWFETTRLAGAIFRAALIAATVIVAARIVAARFTALRCSVLGGRQVAAADGWALRASTAVTSAAAAPAPATATITAAISAAISTAISTTAGAGRIILSGIVVRREILRGRGVRIRLALLGVARLRFLVYFCGVRAMNLAVCGVVFHDAGWLAVRQGIVVRGLLMRVLVVK
jgi:hypothetical protein